MVTLAVTGAHAERVSYGFTASLIPYGGATELTLFNVSDIPANSTASGTFSYDTTTAGVGNGPTIYYQSIDAGFSLDIGDKLHLSAKDFDVRIWKDRPETVEPYETVDIFAVVFDTISAPATPLLVNGVAWTGTSRNFINLQLRYPGDTFHDESLPSGPPAGFYTDWPYSIVGESNSNNSSFIVTSILPAITGDYDGDGAVSPADYDQWRREYGCSGQACGLADGNRDGIVDAADYVIWREAEATSNIRTQATGVPEPPALVLTFLASIGLASVSLRKLE
ncbi:MAG TPA: hypothetical protein VHU84_05255 [Lacipirellulaceae bacterium]|nr:hypothetical protein [Lacipirellulaceae bacterium]